MLVMKKTDSPVRACRLGEDSPLERELLKQGLLRRLPDGGWEVFSQETGTAGGQIARAGDFVKVDGSGRPYPNSRVYFLANHRLAEGRWYQLPKPLQAWQWGEAVPPELKELLESGRLRIEAREEERFFQAELWGTTLTAARNAVILFSREEGEALRFRFVARRDFEESYTILED